VPDFFFATPCLNPYPLERGNKGGTAKSVTEKNNIRVDCAEAAKKTVQAQRYEG